MPGDTRTGQVLEKMINHSLEKGGYEVQLQSIIGERLNGKVHKLDYLAVKNNEKIFISLKWQQSNGTAEEKIPYEVMCLAKAVDEHKKKNKNVRAYLVLGGTISAKKTSSGKKVTGWTLLKFYTEEGLKPYLHPKYASLVKVIKMEDFIALANSGQL